MGEELIRKRNQFILRLLRQNFGCVDGPRLENGNFVFYDVWKEMRDSEQDHRVRIAFGREFLAEGKNDFARTMLQALQNAKSVLDRGKEGTHGGTRQDWRKDG